MNKRESKLLRQIREEQAAKQGKPRGRPRERDCSPIEEPLNADPMKLLEAVLRPRKKDQ